MTASPKYTAALARLYADQGYLRKAAEIYRHLSALQPERADLQEALAEIERQIAGRPSPTLKDAELLMREWIALVKKSRPGRCRADEPTGSTDGKNPWSKRSR